MANLVREAPFRNVEWFPKDGVSFELFNDLRAKGISLSAYLEDLRTKFYNKSTEYTGLTANQIVKKQMERTAMRAKGIDYGPTAIEELFEKADIRIKGEYTDIITKAFDYQDADVVLAEVIANTVYATMIAGAIYPNFLRQTITLDAPEYRNIMIETTAANQRLRTVGVGEELPEIKITIGDKSITMKKAGGYITIPNEHLRWMTFNALATALSQIGLRAQADMTDVMLLTIKNGDGNSNASGTLNATTNGQFDIDDVLAWADALDSPYQLNNFAAPRAMRINYNKILTTMNNPANQFNFADISLPRSHKWDNTEVMATDEMIGVDSRYCIEMFNTGQLNIDTENIVRRQLKGTAIWHWYGFSKLDNNANKIFNMTT